jgi:hypothetical protein
MSVKSFKTSGIKVDLAPQGLVLLNTTSFSGVATQSINDVFSATYQNYFIALNVESSSASDIQFRFRVSGADTSIANYNYAILGLTNANGATNLTAVNPTLIKVGSITNVPAAFAINFFRPFATARTIFTSTGAGYNSAAAASSYTGGGEFALTTSFTGVTFFASAGNITGTARIYGYND